MKANFPKALASTGGKRQLREESVMKKCVLLFSFPLVSTSIVHVQIVIENPKMPSSQNAGRIVHLAEVMRITDLQNFQSDYKALASLD